MKCHHNGVYVEVQSAGEPYQLWSGDEWICECCGVKIITGFGREPVEYFFQKEGYMALRECERLAGNLVILEGES